ncbi:MAG: winged helix-turn-helix domain-containing protein [Acidobacteria bacterium]|nr:winged helix-turn-helix domain-containing protein [Acidobacteriota bacterium]
MGEGRPDILRFGSFELDVRSGELRREGSVVRLQGQPIELLSLLAERAGEVVTREEIQRRVWKNGTFVDFEQGINACVRQIRAAIGDPFEAPRFIQTLPRRGYRFIAPVARVGPPPSAAVAAPVAASRPQRPRLAGSIAAGLLLVATVAAIGWSRASRVAAASPGGAPVVIVLPYRNLSGDPSQGFVCDGLTEELITQLSRRYGRELGVIARTTTMTYRDSTKSAREIAAEVGAGYVLEGSVRAERDRVRITSQLIRAVDEVHLWAGNHDRRLGDTLALESEVSAQIARALALRILPDGAQASAATTPAAYRDYLRGRAALADVPAPRIDEARSAFESAVAEDPGFAPAWTSLARARWMQGAPESAAEASARDALRRALALDDSLSDAHAALAEIRFYHDWDFEGARAEWERALELNPGSAELRHDFAAYWGARGRHDEALRLVGEALRLDPLAPDVLSDVGWYSYFARRYDDAVRLSRETLARTPDFFWAQRCLALSAMLKGDLAAAVPALRAEMLGRGAPPGSVAGLDGADPTAAVRAYWTWDLDRRVARRGKPGASPADEAVARLALGDREGAITALEAAVGMRAGWILPFLGVDPFFDPLRSEPRFERVLDRIGIGPAASR